jgi:hypothetical protein
MNRLEVTPTKVSSAALAVLSFTMLPMGLFALISGLLGGNVVPIGLGVAMLAMYAFVIFNSRRGDARSVKHFAEDGLLLNDGRTLHWTDLERVVERVRVKPSGRQLLWRTEIRFRGGETAWLLPTRIRNFAEVEEFVRQLPCEHGVESA